MAIVACLLAKSLGFGGKDGWCVSLGNGERDEDPDNEREDELDPIEPSPASSIRQETADQWTNCSLLALWSDWRKLGDPYLRGQ